MSFYCGKSCVKKPYLTMPLKHIDFHVIGYWTSNIWSLGHIYLENPAVATQDILSDKQQGICYKHVPTDKTAFNGQVVDHWLGQKIAQTANTTTVSKYINTYCYKCQGETECGDQIGRAQCCGRL